VKRKQIPKSGSADGNVSSNKGGNSTNRSNATTVSRGKQKSIDNGNPKKPRSGSSGASKSNAHAPTRAALLEGMAVGTSSSTVRTNRTSTTTTNNKGSKPSAATTPSSTSGSRQSQVLPTRASLASVPKAIVHHGGGKGEVSSVVTTENVSALYVDEGRDSKKEHQNRMAALKFYVRNMLFPNWKFFSSDKQMIFSSRKGSIVLKICNDLSVHPGSQQYWWDCHRKAILLALNRKRNDVTSYIKKHFCGTFEPSGNHDSLLYLLSCYDPAGIHPFTKNGAINIIQR
jgi:hypothetical protein